MKLKSRVADYHSIDAVGSGLKGRRPAWPDGARKTTAWHAWGMRVGSRSEAAPPPIKSPLIAS
jgi:hypothetical protein